MTDPLDTWPAFAEAVRARLEAGRATYGDRSFERDPDDLLGELAQEALDLAGWGFVLFERIRKQRQALQRPVAVSSSRRRTLLAVARPVVTLLPAPTLVAGVRIVPIFQTTIPHTGKPLQLSRVPCKGELVQLPAGACEACCADTTVWLVSMVKHLGDDSQPGVAALVWVEPTRQLADAERAAKAAAQATGEKR